MLSSQPRVTHLPHTPSPLILVRLAGPRDRAEQAQLSGHCFKKPVTAEALSWRYDQSPHGASISLLSGPEGQDGVCGYACNPRLLVPRGQRERAASVGETGDVMTHPAWRKHGLFRALDARAMQESAQRGWPCVYGLPNRKSAHIFVQMGWRVVGTIRTWTQWLEPDERARALRRREGRWRAWTAPWAFRVSRRARIALERSEALQAPRTTSRVWAHVPQEVERIARSLESTHPLVLQRDAAWLQWRFLQGVSQAFQVQGVYRADQLVGYFVLQRPTSEGVVWLADAAAVDADAWTACAAHALRQARAWGACALRANAIDEGPWGRWLQQWGFTPPRAHDHLNVILYTHDPQHPVAQLAQDARLWWFTDADRDDETMG